MKIFDEFSIKAIPKEENSMTYALVVFSYTLQPCEEIHPYKVEVNFKPSISDNLEHW
jgi:hypothetical protein